MSFDCVLSIGRNPYIHIYWGKLVLASFGNNSIRIESESRPNKTYLSLFGCNFTTRQRSFQDRFLILSKLLPARVMTSQDRLWPAGAAYDRSRVLLMSYDHSKNIPFTMLTSFNMVGIAFGTCWPSRFDCCSLRPPSPRPWPSLCG